MALPPIFSGLPFLKFFKPSPDSAGQGAEQTSSRSEKTADVVDISMAARKNLKGFEDLSSADERTIRGMLDQTRDLLASYPLALGLDPQFS